MDNSTWMYAALLGLGLAASSGLNTFLPLLMLAGAAHFHLLGIQLNGSFAWLASDAALAALALATTVEVVADKIPVVDHMLDVFGTAARPVAGAVAAGAVFTNVDPGVAALAGLVIGAPTALGVHSAKAGTRAASSATTMGIGNPVLSFFEDVAAFFMVLISMAAPVMVPLLLTLCILVMWRAYQMARKRWPLKSRSVRASTI